MIIFGARTRFSRSKIGEVLKKACPNCRGDLELSDLKRWFTLYFIPIFPFSTIETLYKCKDCEKAYGLDIKRAIVGSKKDRAKLEKEAKKLFATTLAACMTHMAKIDGHISKEEQAEIKSATKHFSGFKKDIEKTIDKVKRSKNDEIVFNMLRDAAGILSAQGIMAIIAQVTRVLLADGRIDKAEEKLLKEYLLVCGIPRGMYKEIVAKVKKNM